MTNETLLLLREADVHFQLQRLDGQEELSRTRKMQRKERGW